MLVVYIIWFVKFILITTHPNKEITITMNPKPWWIPRKTSSKNFPWKTSPSRKDYLQKDHHHIIPQKPPAKTTCCHGADKPCQYQVATQCPQEQKRSTMLGTPQKWAMDVFFWEGTFLVGTCELVQFVIRGLLRKGGYCKQVCTYKFINNVIYITYTRYVLSTW